MQNKKIFIEIPTWLGDAVMTTPAIQNIVQKFPSCELIIFGSFVSTKLFTNHPNVRQIIIDNSKILGNRYLNLYKLASSIQKVDIALSFRQNYTTTFLLYFIKSYKKYKYRRYEKKQRHQVLRYNDFVNISLNNNYNADDLKIYLKNKISKEKELLGINPGATYGSAKRWYSAEFAKVCIELSKQYNIIIFGGSSELNIATDIEDILKKNNIINFENKAGHTSVEELIYEISKLSLFVTNDSGPMHIAAAFKVPSICIFGPTRHMETSQWNNINSKIVKKDYSCMPCMKRVCYLKDEQNHQCMKNITYEDVLKNIKELDDNRI
jgi:heptosyltransferase-2